MNKVMLIGRLTREPDVKDFENGGRVAELGFAVNNRRKNKESGEWEDVPVWLHLKAFNHENGRKLADLAANNLHTGRQLYVEGRLALEEWTGKEDGKKHSRTVVYVDQLEFLASAAAKDGAAGGAQAGETAEPAAKPAPAAAPARRGRKPAAAVAAEAPF